MGGLAVIQPLPSNVLLKQAGPIQTVSTTDNTFLIHTLRTCQAYWVTTTAINCGSRVESRPASIEVNDPMNFTTLLDLGQYGPCQSWVATNLTSKQSDLRNFIVGVLNDECRYLVTCTIDDTFSCEDDSKVRLT